MDGLRRRFFRLTLLNILANVTVPLASLVDTALLGHLEEVRFLAGVALAAILFDYLYWSFGFLRMGTTGTTAQALGRGDRAEVYRVLYRSLAVAGLLAAAILLLQRPLEQLGFGLLAGGAGVEAAGRDYFGARIWAAPATLANFVFLGWFLGREESGKALAMAVVGNLANVVADYVLIVRLGLAAYGAGLGTTISQYLMLAVALGLFFRLPERPPWRWRELADRSSLGRLARLNRDILVRTVALLTTFALFTNFSAVLGTVVLAANTVLHRWITLAAYLIDGAAFATESLAGVLRGGGDRAGLARLRRLAFTTGVAFTVPFIAVFVLAPGPALRLLTSQPATLASAGEHALWLVPVLFLGSFAYVYDGLFLGLTAGRSLRNAMLLATFGVFLPLAWVAVRLGSNDLLWAALAAFMLARAAALRVAERHLDV